MKFSTLKSLPAIARRRPRLVIGAVLGALACAAVFATTASALTGGHEDPDLGPSVHVGVSGITPGTDTDHEDAAVHDDPADTDDNADVDDSDDVTTAVTPGSQPADSDVDRDGDAD